MTNGGIITCLERDKLSQRARRRRASSAANRWFSSHLTQETWGTALRSATSTSMPNFLVFLTDLSVPILNYSPLLCLHHDVCLALCLLPPLMSVLLPLMSPSLALSLWPFYLLLTPSSPSHLCPFRFLKCAFSFHPPICRVILALFFHFPLYISLSLFHPLFSHLLKSLLAWFYPFDLRSSMFAQISWCWVIVLDWILLALAE